MSKSMSSSDGPLATRTQWTVVEVKSLNHATQV